MDKDKQMKEETKEEGTIAPVACISCQQNSLTIIGYLLKLELLLCKCSSCHNLNTIPISGGSLETIQQPQSINKKNHYVG